MPAISFSHTLRSKINARRSLQRIVASQNPRLRDLKGAGIFTRFSLIPGFLEYAPYQRISAALACNPNAYFFSYDWRRPPMEHVVALRELVSRVQEETSQKPSIVAHSMGGLITHAYMKTRPNTVDRVVYVGVPFQPGAGFLPDIDLRDGPVDEEAFGQTLNNARAFQKLLDTPASLSNRFMFVVGNCQNTIKAVQADGTFSYEPGDKRMLEES